MDARNRPRGPVAQRLASPQMMRAFDQDGRTRGRVGEDAKVPWFLELPRSHHQRRLPPRVARALIAAARRLGDFAAMNGLIARTGATARPSDPARERCGHRQDPNRRLSFSTLWCAT